MVASLHIGKIKPISRPHLNLLSCKLRILYDFEAHKIPFFTLTKVDRRHLLPFRLICSIGFGTGAKQNATKASEKH